MRSSFHSLSRVSTVLICLLFTVLASVGVFAQAPPAYSGMNTQLTGTVQDGAGDGSTVNTWSISGPSVYVNSTDANTHGWSVGCRTNTTTLTVTVPASTTYAPLGGPYTVSYATKTRLVQGPSGDGREYLSSGPVAQFQVVAAPPTLPVVGGGPAFSWQGSVGGVNTGNGNKLTTVPLTGWTMRGGMAVSCALYHNSQGSTTSVPAGNIYGIKWLPSYYTYLSPGPGAGVTLHWDNGLTYTFSGSTYTPPYGILDKLASTGTGTFTMTTPGGTVYAFSTITGDTTGYGYSYLHTITDLDGNILTINHNADTTLSTVMDASGRTLTYSYGSGHLGQIADPLGRFLGMFYNAPNDLTQVNTPILNGSYYAMVRLGYDSNHNIISLQNPRNNSATFHYDTNVPPRLDWSKNALGSKTTFSYGSSTTTITDPNLHTLTHAYQAGRLMTVTDATGIAESYLYDYNNMLSQKTDRRNRTWYYSSHFSAPVNADGTTTSTTQDAMGNQSTETYDPAQANKLVRSQDALGNTTSLTYSADSKRDLLSKTVTGIGSSPFTATNSIGGYMNGLPTTFKDALLKPSSVAYDTYAPNNNTWGYPVTATDANGNTASTTYNALGWKLTSTNGLNDGLNHTTTTTYDGWGRVTSVTAPDGTSSSTVYDLDGNVVRASDANATNLTFPSGTAGATGYFGAGLAFAGSTVATATASNLGNFGTGDFTASLWVKTSSASTTVQVLVGKRAVQGNSSFFDVYLINGLVHFEVDQDGSATNYANLGGTHAVNDNLWHRITVTRVGAALKIYVDSTVDASGSGPGTAGIANTAPLVLGGLPAYGTTYNYAGSLDEVRFYGRALSASEVSSLVAVPTLASLKGGLLTYWNFSDASGTSTIAYDSCHSVVNTYDADDRLLTTTGGNGDTVTYTYDGPSGYGTTDPSGQTQYGLLSAKTDGNGHTTKYTYTARNEPLTTTYPDGTTESIPVTGGYDGNGNVLKRIKPDGKSISYGYDDDGRLTDITYPTLHVTHFGYDADGRRTQMDDATDTGTSPVVPGAVWTFGDGLHLSALTTPVGSVSYTYDKNGRRKTMGIVVSGIGSFSPWTYGYDDGGRLTSLSNPFGETASFGYDAANRLKQKTKGNNNYETYGYDNSDQLTDTGYYWADATLARTLHYDYDAAGRVAARNENIGSRVVTYGYDGADQVTAETAAGSSPYALSYAYDANGNRLSQGGSVPQSFTYDGHDKLTAGTGETTTYDDNGSLKTDSFTGQSYTYDDDDRLIGVTGPGYTDTFSYNGLGLRVKRVDSGGTVQFLCDGASPGAPVLWSGRSTGYAVYTPGLSMRAGGSSDFYENDRLGNLWTLDSGSGHTSASQVLSTGFGVAWTRTGGLFLFEYGGENGCETDGDTGLVLMGHRYYDPRTGRFITQDPLGDGDNWYAYAGNDPVDAIDPSGLKMKPIGDGYWEDEDSGKVAYGMDGADLSGDSISADGHTIDTGTSRITIGHKGSGDGGSMFQNAGDDFEIGVALVLRSLKGALDFLSRDHHPVVNGRRYCGELPCGTHELDAITFYRGGASFSFKPNEVRINNGRIQPTHGVSVFSNKAKTAKWGTHRVQKVPEGLKIQQRGLDPEHYEIMPEEEMEPSLFEELLSAIEAVPEP